MKCVKVYDTDNDFKVLRVSEEKAEQIIKDAESDPLYKDYAINKPHYTSKSVWKKYKKRGV